MTGCAAQPGVTLHGTALVIGEAGVLLRGESGSGKSRLARELIAAAELSGRFGRLVADDRVSLSFRGGRAVARPVPPLEGLLEIRGLGLAATPFAQAAIMRLVVDIDASPMRLPGPADRSVTLGPVTLPRVVVNPSSATSVVLWRLTALSDRLMTVP